MPAITGPRFLTGSEIRDAMTGQKDFGVLGSRAETLDGRIFRAMEVGAVALVRGNLLQGPANEANHINQVVGDAAAVNDMFISVDLGATALTADQYADGYMVMNDAAGEGICYHVGGHAAAALSATSVRINLTEPVEVALTADTSEYSLHSLWRNVIQSPTTATNVSVGVADFAYAINDYFWGQVFGPVSVLQEASSASTVIGGGVVASDTTAGAVENTANGVTTHQEIGRSLVANVDGEHNGTFLTIGQLLTSKYMALHKAIKFYNPSDEDFVGMWDGEPYDVPAKTTISVPSYIAEHFAKHLANHILQERFENLCREHSNSTKDLLKTCANCKTRSDKLSNLYGVPEREALYKIMLPSDEITSKTTFQSNQEIVE